MSILFSVPVTVQRFPEPPQDQQLIRDRLPEHVREGHLGIEIEGLPNVDACR